MMNIAISVRSLSQSSRSVIQRSDVLCSARRSDKVDSVIEFLKSHGRGLFQTSSRKWFCNTTQKREENCTNDQVQEFCGEEFYGEDFSGGEDFYGDEFHGEDFNIQEFEGEMISRSREFTYRVPIATKTGSCIDDAVSCMSTTNEVEDFHGGDFCGEEFHGEDYNSEEFEGDKIFRTIQFTTRVPILSKTGTSEEN